MYFGFNMTISNKVQYISRKGWEVEKGGDKWDEEKESV